MPVILLFAFVSDDPVADVISLKGKDRKQVDIEYSDVI